MLHHKLEAVLKGGEINKVSNKAFLSLSMRSLRNGPSEALIGLQIYSKFFGWTLPNTSL